MTVEHAFDAAVMMMRSNRRYEASILLWDIIRQNPNHADAWALRARIEAEAGRHANAMLHHGFALKAAPHRYDLWVNRAIDAMGARMHKESEESFLKSLAIEDSYEGHYNYGNLLCSMMRIDEAVEQFTLALEIDNKSNPQIHPNLGTALIAQGKWKEGFQRYRRRFHAPGFPPRPRFDYPQWRGEPLEGKTILLYVEQGFGDEIMSFRFARLIKDMGAQVILSVRPQTFRLARSLAAPARTIDEHAQNCADAVILMYDPPPWKPDYMCALLDIPAFIDVTPETLPLKGGYLMVEDRSYKLEFPSGLNVGICWASGSHDLQPDVATTARAKSLSLEQIAEPLARPGLNLISLQREHDNHSLRDRGIIDPMGGVTDFMDTAWIISQLDLVVTVDTSVAHLAGALNIPVWNLVRFDGLWPWLRETGKTCWYNSMTLYRQERPFDWDSPLKRMAADFGRWVDARGALPASPAPAQSPTRAINGPLKGTSPEIQYGPVAG
jgi:hypothetical protein